MSQAQQPALNPKQGGLAMANRQSHTQAIAAPLYFTGNLSPNPGELSAIDFLRQMEIRMLGNNIVNDADKLSFALNACLLYTSPSPRDRG